MSSLDELRKQRKDLEKKVATEQEVGQELKKIEVLQGDLKAAKRVSEDTDLKKGFRKGLSVLDKGVSGLAKGLVSFGKDALKFLDTIEVSEGKKTKRKKK